MRIIATLALCCHVVLLVECGAARAHAITCVPFADLQAPTTEVLDRLNVKLTHVGYRSRLVPTVVFRKSGSSVAVDASYVCRKSGNDYSADAADLVTCGVTATALQSALDSLATISALVDGGADPGEFLSVSVIDVADTNSRVFDSIVDSEIAGSVLRKLQGAFASNDSALAVLTDMACGLRIHMAVPSVDLSARASATLSGVRYRRSDGLYVSKLRLRNTSMTVLPGPAIVAIRFEGGVRPLSPTGFTGCSADPPGLAYFALPIGSGLDPGELVEVPLVLSNPDRQRVRIEVVKVLAETP